MIEKRDFWIVIGIIVVCGIGLGIALMLKDNTQQEEKQNIAIEEIFENQAIITTVSEEEKVSPNTSFGLKKYYKECRHFEYEEAELPKELVNLTRQEVEDYYDDWEVEEFTDKSLVLSKEINGYCNQHFFIMLEGENVNVYRLGTFGEMDLYQTTDISVDYLPEEDVESLEIGIPIYGEGKISAALEDYE